MTLSVEYLIASPLQVHGTFWLYGVLCAFGVAFVVIFLKETKGLTDQQKKDLYKPVRNVKDSYF